MTPNELLMSIARWLSTQKDLSGLDVSYRNDISPYVIVIIYNGSRSAVAEFRLTGPASERRTEADVFRSLDAARRKIPPARSFRESNV